MEETGKRKLRKRFELETLDDVKRCLAQEVRRLRKVTCENPISDPIKINKARAMCGLLREMREVMTVAEIETRLIALEKKPHGESLGAVQ